MGTGAAICPANCTLKRNVTRNAVITRSYYGRRRTRAHHPCVYQLEKKNPSDKLSSSSPSFRLSIRPWRSFELDGLSCGWKSFIVPLLLHFDLSACNENLSCAELQIRIIKSEE